MLVSIARYATGPEDTFVTNQLVPAHAESPTETHPPCWRGKQSMKRKQNCYSRVNAYCFQNNLKGSIVVAVHLIIPFNLLLYSLLLNFSGSKNGGPSITSYNHADALCPIDYTQ